MSYDDDILSSAAICLNCMGLKQIETDGGETLAYHSTSQIDYVPDTTASNAPWTSFYDCGVRGAFDRTWSTATTHRKFRELLKNAGFCPRGRYALA